MPVKNRIADWQEDLTEWRRHLHAHPELRFEEHETARFVAEKLRAFGCDEVIEGVGQTGVVAVIRGRQGGSGRTIAFRADMDALPILEQTGADYASTVPGKMHACGHDGHTTMLLGACRYLAETRNFDGTVVALFQPAEEGGGGGKGRYDGWVSLQPPRGLHGITPFEGGQGYAVWKELVADYITDDGRGMTDEERGHSNTLVYQYLPSRYGMTPTDLRRADAIEIVVGQGAKPGGGGMLLGQKISDRVAEMRNLPKGIDQRSACRHPDWVGPDDLKIKIEELREITDWEIPIYVKLGATRVREDVKLAVKAGADVVVVDGMQGGTAATQQVFIEPPVVRSFGIGRVWAGLAETGA